MPCQYYTDRELTDNAYRALNELTRVCCDMRTILRQHNLFMELTVETRNWIKQHDEEDRKRIEADARRLREKSEREQARQSAMNKLTLEERRVLGL